MTRFLKHGEAVWDAGCKPGIYAFVRQAGGWWWEGRSPFLVPSAINLAGRSGDTPRPILGRGSRTNDDDPFKGMY